MAQVQASVDVRIVLPPTRWPRCGAEGQSSALPRDEALLAGDGGLHVPGRESKGLCGPQADEDQAAPRACLAARGRNRRPQKLCGRYSLLSKRTKRIFQVSALSQRGRQREHGRIDRLAYMATRGMEQSLVWLYKWASPIMAHWDWLGHVMACFVVVDT